MRFRKEMRPDALKNFVEARLDAFHIKSRPGAFENPFQTRLIAFYNKTAFERVNSAFRVYMG